MPKNWAEFAKGKHRVLHFRKFKHDVEKQEGEKKRGGRRRSRERRSRSREGDRKSRGDKKSAAARVNLLDTPLVLRKPLLAMKAHRTPVELDAEFAQYLVCYSRVKPSLTFCENPRHATRHLASREAMLATVPADVEEVILGFIDGIVPKSFESKPVVCYISPYN
ncbi:hypothetical protein LSTR_LSTR015875 [Laodelphax striatellus]|uniref:Uncharacterized protein n=1 Tax=Laodelphax striatellus TaxID=195883 RepID=A0A482WQF1_LAOST|nr:hypothetical protein LSTR_LSTR015875 [Laodelphax striatellus]